MGIKTIFSTVQVVSIVIFFKRILPVIQNNFRSADPVCITETTDFFRWEVYYTQQELSELIRNRLGILCRFQTSLRVDGQITVFIDNLCTISPEIWPVYFVQCSIMGTSPGRTQRCNCLLYTSCVACGWIVAGFTFISAISFLHSLI